MLNGDQLVGGLYLCAEHEFEEGADWGQLHYFFVAEGEKGKGLHSLLVDEAVRRATSWGLRGLYVNTDRFGLPEVYQRWGAQLWKMIPKTTIPLAPPERTKWSWRIEAIRDAAVSEAIRRFARGDLLEIGSGDARLETLTHGIVTRHIRINHPNVALSCGQGELRATAYDTALPDSSVDTVLCTAAFGCLERPPHALREFYRVLRPGGVLIVSAPLYLHAGDEPRGFYRYTQHALAHLLEEAGLAVVRIQPLSGFIVTFAQESCYYLEAVGHRRFPGVVRGLQRMLQALACSLHSRGWDNATEFTWCYVVVGRRPPL
jgi:SAM-dependent methyltransferase